MASTSRTRARGLAVAVGRALIDPLMWRLAVGGGLLVASLALAYVPGLVAPEAPTETRNVTLPVAMP